MRGMDGACGRKHRLGEVGATGLIGALLAALLLGCGGPIATAAPSSPPSPTPSAVPSTPAPSLLASEEPNPALEIPQELRRTIPIPAGAQLLDLVAADGDWVAVMLTPTDGGTATDTLYAYNLVTGVSRELPGSSGAGVSEGRMAWLDWTCTASGGVPGGAVCTSWKLHLTDLETGSDRVVVSGKSPETVGSPLYPIGDETVGPALALRADTLAYSTGGLASGFTLHLVTLSSGAERTIELEGMVEEMHWAGADLVWVEYTDLQLGGLANGYSSDANYTATRLMLLPDGGSAARQIAEGPFWLAAEEGRCIWDTSDIGGEGNEVWMAEAPDWQPVRLATSSAAATMGVSSGWAGWGDYDLNVFLVQRRGDSAPRPVPDGYGLAGGWLFLAKPDDGGRHTTLEAVRIADLA
jgi:hypothetical protein